MARLGWRAFLAGFNHRLMDGNTAPGRKRLGAFPLESAASRLHWDNVLGGARVIAKHKPASLDLLGLYSTAAS